MQNRQFQIITKDNPQPQPVCPYFNKILNDIMSRDWSKISKEISAIIEDMDYIEIHTPE